MSVKSAPRISQLSNWAVISLFFLAIASPSLRMLASPTTTRWSASENRMLAAMPSAPKSIRDFTVWRTGIDNFLNDHFGFRERYIGHYQRETMRLFNVISTSVPVLKGLDGWYFFTMFGLIDDFYGRMPLSDTELQAWVTAQEAKKRWLNERGIRYLLFIPPNKQSIYPQMLAANALKERGQSRYDQLLAKMGGHTPDFMPDVRHILSAYAAKPSSPPLYYQTDTHWNDLGAYLAFQETMKKLSAWFPDAGFKTDFRIIPQVTERGGNTGRGGDLAMMMMRRDLRETYPKLAPINRGYTREPLPCPISDLPRQPDRPSYMTRLTDADAQADGKPKALVFRDSFFVPMEQLFSENFSEVLYLWKSYDQKDVEEALQCFKPDVVIEETLERHMFDFLLEPEKKP